MKITLPREEKSILDNLAGMLGLNANVAKEVSVETENGDTVITIAPEFVTDYFQLIMSIAPMIKWLVGHAMSVADTIETMGANFEKKWNAKLEEEVA